MYFLVLCRYKRGGVWLFGSLDLKERGNILKIRLLIGLNKEDFFKDGGIAIHMKAIPIIK